MFVFKSNESPITVLIFFIVYRSALLSAVFHYMRLTLPAYRFTIVALRAVLRHFTKLRRPEMEAISKIWMGPLPQDSPYVKPFRLYYVQNGVEKNWDLLKVHDSVAIVIYNTTRKVLIFVRQFRPAVFHSIVTSAGSTLDNVDLKEFPPKLGVTLELCAGIVDKQKSWCDIAREEIMEEVGYDVPVDRIEEVLTYRSGVGSSGAKQSMYYCEVTDADKVNDGGGIDEEIIEVVEYSVEEARKMLAHGANINSPPSCLLGITWFLMNKAPKLE